MHIPWCCRLISRASAQRLTRTSILAHLPGGEEDTADTEGVEDGAEGAGPRKRKIRSGVSTLESNEENLCLKDLEYQITTDPLFQKTSASFDEGGAKGMLLNNLNVQNGCQIVFDSSDAIDEGSAEDGASPVDDDELELGDLAGELNDLFSSIGGAELTPGFTQFRLGHMNPQAAETSLVIGMRICSPRVRLLVDLAVCLRSSSLVYYCLQRKCLRPSTTMTLGHLLTMARISMTMMTVLGHRMTAWTSPQLKARSMLSQAHRRSQAQKSLLTSRSR